MKAPSTRTELKRKSSRGRYAREDVHAVVDACAIAYVGCATARGPLVLPMAIGRIDDTVYLHGASTNGLLAHITSGGEVCVCSALIDGWVLAKSALHHSMNYRSFVAFAKARRVHGEEQERALEAVVEHMLPGRAAETRAASAAEQAATFVVAVDLHEASVKVRAGTSVDATSDRDLPYWSGVLPIERTPRLPLPSPDASETPAPDSVVRALLCAAPRLDGVREQGDWEVSGDPGRIDFARVLHWLQTDAYWWSEGLTRDTLLLTVPQSFWVGAYREDEQLGVARIVSDGATFAWLCDVYVGREHRGRGVGKALVGYAVEHLRFAGVRRWMLGTRDAQGLYEGFGFSPVDAGRFLQRCGPRG